MRRPLGRAILALLASSFLALAACTAIDGLPHECPGGSGEQTFGCLGAALKTCAEECHGDGELAPCSQTWAAQACPGGSSCVAERRGTGICITDAAARTCSFAEGVTGPRNGVGGDGTGAMAFDLNGDGADDLVVTSGTAFDVYLADGKGALVPAAHVEMGVSLGPTALAGDVDGDGRMDLVFFADHALHAALAVGGGDFRPAPPVALAPADGPLLGLGDFDHDGAADVAYACQNLPGRSSACVRWGGGAAPFARSGPTTSLDAAIDNLPAPFFWADFDGDGTPELALGQTEHFVPRADGTFAPGAPLGTSPWPLALEAFTGDFDGDGRRDVAFYEGNVTVVLGVGAPGSAHASHAAGAQSYRFVADVDGDGKDDLVEIGGPDMLLVGVRHGQAGGLGDERWAYPGERDHAPLTVGDFDHDGAADVLLAGPGPMVLRRACQ